MTRCTARRRGMLVGALFLAAATVPALMGRPAWIVIASLALCLIAAAIAVEDLTTMLIPDGHTAGIALTATLVFLGEGNDVAALLRMVAVAVAFGLALFLIGLAYARLRGREGIGFGDVKLLAASAMLVGVWGVGLQLILASMAAAMFVTIRAIRRRRPLRSTARVPFGAFLAPALVIIWAWFPV